MGLADLLIGVGSIAPNSVAGFSKSGKIIAPGIDCSSICRSLCKKVWKEGG